MPRFVVLTHDHPFPHWDFMLESGELLRTWRLLQSPDSTQPVKVVAIADHRLAYLEYEGPVSGDRGSVARWDAGEFTPLDDALDRIELQLAGSRLSGRFVLLKQDGQNDWTFQSLTE